MQVIAYFPLVGRSKKLTRQNSILEHYAKMKKANVLDRFIESESGLEQLQRAIAAAEEQKAYLLFVTLGRYGKNLKVLDLLSKSDVEFITPGNRRFVRRNIGKLLEKAQQDQHDRIERIRDGMTKAAKNGEKYGSARPGHWNRKNNHLRGWKKANEVAVQRRARRCADAYLPLIPLIAAGRKKGDSFDAIAIALNEAGHLTLTGSPFSAATVFKIYKRLGGQNGRTRRKQVGRQVASSASQ